ncbi:MAG: GIY-YIG nuclease family protein [Methyloceanibacter sp.]
MTPNLLPRHARAKTRASRGHSLKRERFYYVYILASGRNGTLYIGVTNDIARRMYEHKEGLVPGFTKQYGVTKLVHCEPFESISYAIQREKNLKKWPRKWKLDLIERDNPQWQDLAEQPLW